MLILFLFTDNSFLQHNFLICSLIRFNHILFSPNVRNWHTLLLLKYYPSYITRHISIIFVQLIFMIQNSSWIYDRLIWCNYLFKNRNQICSRKIMKLCILVTNHNWTPCSCSCNSFDKFLLKIFRYGAGGTSSATHWAIT